jgi:hypothetical protein
VEIKTRKLFKELIKKLTLEILDEEELDEITTTGNVAGYSTPFAFTGKKGKKKKKKKVDEALEDKDLKIITKLIRNVVGDILRDIWLKRTAWK